MKNNLASVLLAVFTMVALAVGMATTVDLALGPPDTVALAIAPPDTDDINIGSGCDVASSDSITVCANGDEPAKHDDNDYDNDDGDDDDDGLTIDLTPIEIRVI